MIQERRELLLDSLQLNKEAKVKKLKVSWNVGREKSYLTYFNWIYSPCTSHVYIGATALLHNEASADNGINSLLHRSTQRDWQRCFSSSRLDVDKPCLEHRLDMASRHQQCGAACQCDQRSGARRLAGGVGDRESQLCSAETWVVLKLIHVEFELWENLNL